MPGKVEGFDEFHRYKVPTELNLILALTQWNNTFDGIFRQVYVTSLILYCDHNICHSSSTRDGTEIALPTAKTKLLLNNVVERVLSVVGSTGCISGRRLRWHREKITVKPMANHPHMIHYRRRLTFKQTQRRKTKPKSR